MFYNNLVKTAQKTRNQILVNVSFLLLIINCDNSFYNLITYVNSCLHVFVVLFSVSPLMSIKSLKATSTSSSGKKSIKKIDQRALKQQPTNERDLYCSNLTAK